MSEVRQGGSTGEEIEGLDQQPGGTFAGILINDGVLTAGQVKKSVRVQEKLGASKLLSTIFVELGMLTEDEHRRLVCKHGRSFRLGELFCELGYITLAQLLQAELVLKQSPGKRIGAIFRELGMIDDRQLAQALSEQLRIPLIHIDLDTADHDLMRQFPVKFMRMHLAVPYEASATRVSIATANPLDNPAIEEVERRLRKKAVVVIAAESALLSMLGKLEMAGGKGSEQHDQVAEVVDSILLAAIRQHASDIHIEPMESHTRIRLRLDGVLIHKMDLPSELAQRVIARLKVLASMDISDSRRHQDGRFSRDVGHINADYRVSTYVTIYGENMVMRVLRSTGGLKNIEQISMSRGLLDRFKHEALDVPTGVRGCKLNCVNALLSKN
ncbi:GspE/PulE family protein [Mariprofundus ferrooxydans]|uniref:ATPase involved in pili biogenesis n=1 Tax=Mariprofundus ferrooxydans PV-1 TaxID=314345 RepID=Q0EWN1_9PROT|nr:ATPase, T2SS/T4P/T4SS family [Mariprofundus ferrooxydans]EAU53646.1 ATPase involved in pili biogenesis [Mariprofundus ferrooxydans PV-1]